MQNVDGDLVSMYRVFSFTDKDGLTSFGINEGRYGEN